MTKVFITKYALTQGIEEMESESFEGRYVSIEGEYALYRVGKDCFFTKEEAIAKAEEMRKKKIEALQRQIKKLESMKF